MIFFLNLSSTMSASVLAWLPPLLLLASPALAILPVVPVNAVLGPSTVTMVGTVLATPSETPLAQPPVRVNDIPGFTNYVNLMKPIPVPTIGVCAVQTLMVHSFDNGDNAPFVSTYAPPTCAFNSVIINFAATSVGQPVSRLAELFVTDTEIWRTGMAQPTASGGVSWSYTKDVSQYMALWTRQQHIIFSLANVNGTNTAIATGSYNVTLTATFFQAPTAPVHADVILPISTRSGGTSQQSVFTVPISNATVPYSIPTNVTQAIVSILASGQAADELFVTSLLTSNAQAFASTAGQLPGGGPFREVQLLIDGQLAGVIWPYPVVYTHSIAPALWTPIVGISALDLLEGEINITPFLPLLTDGAQHTFTIKVMQLAETGGNGVATLTQVQNPWVVSGKIFLFYGTSSTTYAKGKVPTVIGQDPIITLNSSTATGSNALSYSVSARRSLTIASPSGSWAQTLWFNCNGLLSNGGLAQAVNSSVLGSNVAVNQLNHKYDQIVSYIYPLDLSTNTVNVQGGGVKVAASITHGLSLTDSGRPDISVFSGVSGAVSIDTSQVGKAAYGTVPGQTYSYGNLIQHFSQAANSRTFVRTISAVNGTQVANLTSNVGLCRPFAGLRFRIGIPTRCTQ